MADDAPTNPRDAQKAAMKARMLEQFEQKWAELERLAGDLGVAIVVPDGDGNAPKQAQEQTKPAKDTSLRAVGFTGTAASLIDCYQTHPESRYHKLHPSTRTSYDSLLRALRRDIGEEKIGDLADTETLLRTHAIWTIRGKAMAHALVTQLRILSTFGNSVLKDASCRALRVTLHDMDFPVPEKRTERLTADDVIKIRAKAHEMGFPSIALAQAIQFETPLRQRDVIGEWVSIDQPGTSDVIDGDKKWLRGLRWSEIDENLLLTHPTPSRGLPIVFDLRSTSMVREELARLGRERPTTATPVIIYEATGKPYVGHQFRRVWREIADAVGISKKLMNMDSSSRKNVANDQQEKKIWR